PFPYPTLFRSRHLRLRAAIVGAMRLRLPSHLAALHLAIGHVLEPHVALRAAPGDAQPVRPHADDAVRAAQALRGLGASDLHVVSADVLLLPLGHGTVAPHSPAISFLAVSMSTGWSRAMRNSSGQASRTTRLSGVGLGWPPTMPRFSRFWTVSTSSSRMT